jgi:hypothetical protein
MLGFQGHRSIEALQTPCSQRRAQGPRAFSSFHLPDKSGVSISHPRGDVNAITIQSEDTKARGYLLAASNHICQPQGNVLHFLYKSSETVERMKTMKQRRVALTIVSIAVFVMFGLVSVVAMQPDGPALVRISSPGQADWTAVEAVGVPVYARLTGEGGTYLLAGAALDDVEALQKEGLDVTLLDPDMRGASYFFVYPGPDQSQLPWNDFGHLLLDDGGRVLLRTSARNAERLVQAGAELQALTLTPKPLRAIAEESDFPPVTEPNPFVQAMIDQVSSTIIYSYTGDLSGEWPVEVGGSTYTISSRHTSSGTPIQKATQYTYEHLEALGLGVDYHYWSGGGYSGRNVIGELTGQSNPDDIFIISAHIDDMPSVGDAPGADDNASGTVAVMIAADILTQYQWDCTLRFALWTGEEQGLLGSGVYAANAYSAGENIVGVLNLDMIAWDATGGPDIDLHANQTDIPTSMDLADLFVDVVSVYDLNLVPQIISAGTTRSDHGSFWDYGYTAILGIEDFYPNYHDFNPYYHTSNDKLEHLNKAYYTEFVKASVGTFAHMGCLLTDGTLTGQVTDVDTGLPIGGATVLAQDQLAQTFQTSTDGTGFYTFTLETNSYTVTATANGYLSATVTGVNISPGQVTTQHFALEPDGSCVAVYDADFDWIPLAPAVSETVRFVGTASGDAPIFFDWDFGDGEVYKGAVVSYTYTLEGEHTVVMTATGACGLDVVSHTLNILPECIYYYLPLVWRGE